MCTLQRFIKEKVVSKPGKPGAPSGNRTQDPTIQGLDASHYATEKQ